MLDLVSYPTSEPAALASPGVAFMLVRADDVSNNLPCDFLAYLGERHGVGGDAALELLEHWLVEYRSSCAKGIGVAATELA